MNCSMQNVVVILAENGKWLTENKRRLNLSQLLGDEIIALFRVKGVRQIIRDGFHLAVWEYEHGFW